MQLGTAFCIIATCPRLWSLCPFEHVKVVGKNHLMDDHFTARCKLSLRSSVVYSIYCMCIQFNSEVEQVFEIRTSTQQICLIAVHMLVWHGMAHLSSR